MAETHLSSQTSLWNARVCSTCCSLCNHVASKLSSPIILFDSMYVYIYIYIIYYSIYIYYTILYYTILYYIISYYIILYVVFFMATRSHKHGSTSFPVGGHRSKLFVWTFEQIKAALWQLAGYCLGPIPLCWPQLIFKQVWCLFRYLYWIIHWSQRSLTIGDLLQDFTPQKTGVVHATDGSTYDSDDTIYLYHSVMYSVSYPRVSYVSWILHLSSGCRDILAQMVSSVRMVQDEQLVDMRWDVGGAMRMRRICDGFANVWNHKDIQDLIICNPCVIHVYPYVSSI